MCNMLFQCVICTYLLHKRMLGHDGDKQYGGQPPNNTFFYDPITETFRTGQDMNYHRVNAGCAQFESAYHGGRPIVIVVGGTSKGGDYKPLKKTEILDYTVTDEWSECKSFLLKKKSFSAYKQKFAKINYLIKNRRGIKGVNEQRPGWPGFPRM